MPPNEGPTQVSQMPKIPIPSEAMPTEQLGKTEALLLEREQAYRFVLHSKLGRFLDYLIGMESSCPINSDCKVWVKGGVVRVEHLNGAIHTKYPPRRKFTGHDMVNLAVILDNNYGLVDDYKREGTGYCSFSVPVERFDKVIACGSDEARDAYPPFTEAEYEAIRKKTRTKTTFIGVRLK